MLCDASWQVGEDEGASSTGIITRMRSAMEVQRKPDVPKLLTHENPRNRNARHKSTYFRPKEIACVLESRVTSHEW